MQKAAQLYNQTSLTTTSPGQVLISLYDGAINFIVRAKAKMREKDYAGKGILISKVMDIINELDSSLNPGKGGDLAENLHNLYFICNTKLATANLRMDPAPLDEVIKILSGLRSAYAHILDTPEAMNAAQEITANQAPDAASAPRKPVAFTEQAPSMVSGAKRNSAYSVQQRPFGAAPAFSPMFSPEESAPAAPQATYTPAAQNAAPAEGLAKQSEAPARPAEAIAAPTPPVAENPAAPSSAAVPPPGSMPGQGLGTGPGTSFGAGFNRNAMNRYASGFSK